VIELLVLRDGREVDRYMLGAGAATLGRADDCDLLLDDSAVSRMHARVTVEGGRVFLADLGSGNGTWFQGLKVREMEIEDGAEFRIEPFTLRIAISRTNAGVAANATRPVDARPPDEPFALFEQSVSSPRMPGGSAAVGPRLERVRGSDGPILLGRTELVVGRGDDVSLPLRDGSISRRHAKLTFADDRFTLEDLRSANGTWVNGERLTGSRILTDGDRPRRHAKLTFADDRFTLEDLRSANGTWVNGERLTGSRILTDGDRLRFGNTELLFVDPSAGTVSASEMLVPTKPVLLEEEPARVVPAVELSRAARRSPTPHPRKAPVELPPVEAPEHTEAGAPPPSAFTDFDAPPVYEETESGGLLEISAIGPAPREDGAVRRRWLLAGIAVGVVLFLGILMVRPAGPAGVEPEPDKMQRTMLQTMERMTVEAEAALMKEPKDFAKALDFYGRVSAFGKRDELLSFARARELQRSSTEMVSVLHEALLTRALRAETARRSMVDGETGTRIAAQLAAANDGIVAGRRGGLDGFDRAIRALAAVLALSPGHSGATRLLAEIKPERDALARKNAGANRATTDRACAAIHARAAAKHATGSAEGLKAAIALYDDILEKDPAGVTAWPGRARADTDRALKTLAAKVAPLRDSARRSMTAGDTRAARTFLRKAVATNPFDPQIKVELDAAHAECLRSAVRHLQSAKTFDDARNYGEAIKSIDLGQTYADRPEEKLWQQLEELRKRIRRANER